MTTTTKIASQRIDTKVGRLHIETRGIHHVGDEPVVFCWPSLYADTRTLDAIAEGLENDHRVIVVDGPGHGKSGAIPPSDDEPSPSPKSKSKSFTLADCADAAMEIFDALRVDHAFWIGTAWGGQVGVAAALRHPDRLDGLVMSNSPMMPWTGKRLALMRLGQGMLRVFGPKSSFATRIIADKSIAKSIRDKAERDGLVEQVASALRRTTDVAALHQAVQSAMFEREDLVPRLPDVRVRAGGSIVFFAGTEDEIFPLEEARAQANAIPGCKLVEVERSSHHSLLERVDVVLPVIREALRSISVSGAVAQPVEEP